MHQGFTKALADDALLDRFQVTSRPCPEAGALATTTPTADHRGIDSQIGAFGDRRLNIGIEASVGQVQELYRLDAATRWFNQRHS